MKILVFLVVACAALASSGCFGLPDGAADTGDTVSVRYTTHDLATGAEIRVNRTATFAVGSGDSGLGLAFESSVRGHTANETYTVEVRDDPSLAFSGVVEVDRALPPIPVHQEAPRADFDASQFGPASVGKGFTAYGIYNATVTAVNATTVNFDVNARDGQQDEFPSIGATLVTHVVGDSILRTLDPNVGAVFAIPPPTQFNPRTPLGLDPGSYKVLGATETKIQYSYTDSLNSDLVGKPLRYTITVVRITPGNHDLAPTGDNYGQRESPHVNGDPNQVLGGTGEIDDDHLH